MLIKVHYGDDCVLLVNGNCRPISILDYIREHCCLTKSIQFDLCLLSNGEPFHLSPTYTKVLSAENRCLPFHCHCVLTRIDEEGRYIPLLNDPTLITKDFLTKLKRATSTTGNSTKIPTKPMKQTNKLSVEKPKRRRSLKSVGIAATFVTQYKH